MNRHEKIDYIEFPASDIKATKAFFADAFDWSFEDYVPECAAFADQGIDGGFFKSDLFANTDKGSALVVFYCPDLGAARAKVEKAGDVSTLRSRAGMN